jgi:aminoglycoside 3-N-acetyltransferase
MDTWIRGAKDRLRPRYRKLRQSVIDRFFSYGPEELLEALRRLGVQPGDAVMVHAQFSKHHGFRGSVDSAIDAFLRAVGPQGSLLMVSMPFRASAADYLAKLKYFDVCKTPSAMGLLSEFFRRRDGVLRSAHASHPILAYGQRAEWFVADHERSVYPCGTGSPLEKLLEVGGKVLFFNVRFDSFTFIHYLQHRIRAHLDFPMYTDKLFDARVVDGNGREFTMQTYAFSRELAQRQRPFLLASWLAERGLIRRVRVGASRLMLVEVAQVTRVVDEMTERGEFFFAPPAEFGKATVAG